MSSKWQRKEVKIWEISYDIPGKRFLTEKCSFFTLYDIVVWHVIYEMGE